MSAEESMALARRFMEARINGNLDAVDGMLAADFINHNRLLPGQELDRENYTCVGSLNIKPPSPSAA